MSLKTFDRTTLDRFPRLELGRFPSPVRNVSLPDGPTFWVKDDGACCDGYGGNKVRKFEYLFAEARQQRRRRLVVCGDTGSHTVMAGGLLGRAAGFAVAAMVYSHEGPMASPTALGRLAEAGVEIHRHRTLLACLGHARWLGLRPGTCVVPLGGSTPYATLGYVRAAGELLAQVGEGRLPEPEKIFIAFATGGSVAGLLIGLTLAEARARVVAVRTADAVIANRRRIERLVRQALAVLKLERPHARECMARLEMIDSRFLGKGYRAETVATAAALRVAATGGLELEPVFTGKAFAALLAALPQHQNGSLLFWNTHDQAGRLR